MSFFFILLWLIFWLLPMIVTAKLASRQRRNVPFWVIASFFFGWIPAIILLALSGL